MEVSTETWRVKVPKKKKAVTLCFPTKCKCKCSEEHKEKCRDKKKCKRLYGDPSMLSIATSLNENCCVCIGACARYIKAIFECVGCFMCCRLPIMQFEQILCEVLGATGDACQDIFLFIKKILKLCSSSKKHK